MPSLYGMTLILFTVVPNGHTGHVRFLTAIRSERSLVVISGGDGLESYGVANKCLTAEESGREDSTNHLLLFQIN